jgi:RND family efflux transporter MFP subunit
MSFRRASSPLFAVAVVTSLLAACNRPADADPRTEAPTVSVTQVVSDGEGTQRYTGVVSARVLSDLGFRVAGKVVERLVDVGQSVKRGQPLMRLDGADLSLALDAQAAAVSAARARALQASADEVRLRALVSQGAISTQAYELARAAADSAHALVDAAQAQQRVARNQADYSVLAADADGIVVDALAEPGQVVRAGEPVIRLARAGQREALVSLPETVRPAPGSIAQASLASLPGRTFAAHLRQLSGSADARSRTYEARYVLDGDAAQAPLGATVTVLLSNAKAEGVMRVPLAALHDAGQGTGVWVVNEAGTAVAFRPVTVSRLEAESASISAGLVPGERIVAMGAHLLHEGQTVRVGAPIGGRP